MNEILTLRRRAGVTQSRLAELAGTSQPTIAAYESGSKVPNLRTLRKLARALGLEARLQFVPALTREDRRSLALHEAIARRLIEDPGVDVLLDPRPRARELRQVTPFAGILSPAERAEVYRRFAASERTDP